MTYSRTSSVARGGAGGLEPPPHWLVKYVKSHVFCAFEAEFLWKIGNSPPSNVWICEIGRKISVNFGEDLFFFFWDHLILGGKNVWISDFGRKITLNFSEDLFFFFFYGEHLILGGKNLWILDFSRNISPNFGEDLFVFFFWRTPDFRRKKTFEFPSFPRNFVSIFGQTVWNWFKFNENSSQGRLHTSHSFKIAPPPFSKSWLRACLELL